MTNTTNESKAMEVWLGAWADYQLAMSHINSKASGAAARVIATALEARDARIRELEGALEFAWRDGFQNARDCLSDDEAFCLTVDVEEDAWLDSAARRAILTKQEKDHD